MATELQIVPKGSCDGFLSDTTTSSEVDLKCSEKKKLKKENLAESDARPSCSNMLSTSTSSSSSVSAGYFNVDCKDRKFQRKEPPNIGYEICIAKSILQQCSTLSGDNLFDHLSDLIKRVIDERPPNIIDFFEEFSRNVREQKFHLPERFPPDAICAESRNYKVAKKILLSMKLPMTEESEAQGRILGEDVSEESILTKKLFDDLELQIDNDVIFKTYNDRVQQLQFYWNQCGFSISSDDIFQLACSMDRLMTHPTIMQCRFWGVINGLKAPYYIVEVALTREETKVRLETMVRDMNEKIRIQFLESRKKKPLPTFVGPELSPGIYGWENYQTEDLAQMQPSADPIPVVEEVEAFDVAPEFIGQGLNRHSYFVVNSLTDEWIELPIVQPKHIITSRYMKKLLTGDLEADILAYPCFQGKEKHYLRAMIARITSSSHIAPKGCYRKMTKREKRIYEGLNDDEMEEEEEEETEGEEEEDEVDNDILLIQNEKYDPPPTGTLNQLSEWVHVRPHILNQGRIVWFDERKALKERDKVFAQLLRGLVLEEVDEEEQEEEDEAEAEDEEGEGEEEEDAVVPERGPPILRPLNFDVSDEYTIPWTARFSSRFTGKNERIIVMRSNVWPGAYTFAFGTIVESVYMGWGHKYNSRNLEFKHLPPLEPEYPHEPNDFIEKADPSTAKEEAYRLSVFEKKHVPSVGGEEEGLFEANNIMSGGSDEEVVD